MKKQIGTLAIGILMLAGAMSMYSGESTSFQTNLTNPAYTVMGNSSNLDGLSVEFENSNITIISDHKMKSDNFTLIFFDKIIREVTHTVNSGGGSEKITRYVDRNVTTFVPKYINTTNEVEKIIDNTMVLDEEYKLWHIILMGAICMLFGGLVVNNWVKRE